MIDRHALICPYFRDGVCGSCSLIQEGGEISSILPSMPKELSVLAKRTNDWVSCSSPFFSRAKAKMSVSGTFQNPVIGILDSELKGVELLNCPLHKNIINKALSLLPNMIMREKLSPYVIKDRKGDLKGIILQTNLLEDHLRIRFVLGSIKERGKIESIVSSLSSELGVKLSASINIQAVPHQILEGPEEVHLFGEELLWETYSTAKVAFPAQSFMQVTPEIASKLYEQVTKIVSKAQFTSAVDLFCGAGGFALSLAPHVKQIYGIEISKAAVESAKLSAQEANYENVEFVEEDLLSSIERLNYLGPELLICNPPRRGLGELVIEAIMKNLPQVVIYSSCNPNTLLKDIQNMSERYALDEITPFEMFPLTNHFETLAVLIRK